MPDRTFVPQACSTENVIVSAYTYQDNFMAPFPLWNPMNTANIMWGGPNNMMVNCNAPNDGTQQTLPCVGGLTNVLDLTISYGQNDILITLLDPMTLLPLPGFPMFFPAMPPGTMQNIQLFFNGPPTGNVIVQITSPSGPFPFPDMFIVNYAAISTQTTVPTQVCWDEDYRFGFNGMEKDNEAKGQGNSYDFGARIYDSRLGRWLSLDEKAKEFPYLSPFNSMSNNPLNIIDPDGRSGVAVMDPVTKTITITSKLIFYGTEAKTEVSHAVATEIAEQYNNAGAKVMVAGVEYTVKFRVKYETVTESEAIAKAATNTDPTVNFIRVEKNNTAMNRSFYQVGGNSGFLNTDDDLGSSTTAPHEVGHGFGLGHSAGDQRGMGTPDVMAARGTLVDAAYQWDPTAIAGAPGGTINPSTREVNQQNVTDILSGVTFDSSGKATIGTTTNQIYNKDGTKKP